MNALEQSLAFTATGEEIASLKSLAPALLPKISVVIPSYNQAKFIAETIESVLAQNYPNLEIFVADGGSIDGTGPILARYAEAHPGRFRYESKPDGGHYQGVNKGLAATQGEIIAWINSDDVYLPETFWKIVTFFHFNRAAMVVYGRNRYVDEALNFVCDYPADWSPLIREQRRRMMHFCLAPQPSLLFRRIAVTLCGALNHWILDYELWLRWQQDLPFFFYDDFLSLSRLHHQAVSVKADDALLRGICEVVHGYYGAVPLSWALKYAHIRAHGAAWAQGRSPPVTRRIRLAAIWLWLTLNLRYCPRALARVARQFGSWFRDSCRSHV